MFMVSQLNGHGAFPAPTQITIDAPDGSAGLNGYTMISRDAAVLNGVTVNSIGMYSLFAGSIVLKLCKRNSANNYDIVVSQTISHGGTGFEDLILSAGFPVPGTGTYYLGAYQALGVSNNVKTSMDRAYVTANITGNGQTTTGEDSGGQGYPLRYTYL